MRLAESLTGAPGIDSAAVADFITFNDSYVQTLVKTVGSPAASIHGIHSLLVDSGYFDALRIPLIAGRAFTRRDDERAPKVAVLAESAARRLFRIRIPSDAASFWAAPPGALSRATRPKSSAS